MLQIIPFDVNTNNSQSIASILELLDKAEAELSSFQVLPTDPNDTAIKVLTNSIPNEQQPCWIAWWKHKAVGLCYLRYSDKRNLRVANLRVIVDSQYRRQGIGSALTQVAQDEALAIGRHLLLANSNSLIPAGAAFATKLAAQPTLQIQVSQLALDTISSQHISEWRAASPTHKYHLKYWKSHVPDEYLSQYATVLKSLNDSPHNEEEDDFSPTAEEIRALGLQAEQRGEVIFYVAAVDQQTGQLVGVSESSWSPTNPQTARQMVTTVVPSARQQGIGRWIKAEMLAILQQQAVGAKFIRTTNVDSNDHILRINRDMGFLHHSMNTQWSWRI